MEVNLSQEEYKNLIEMLYIAEWVMNSHNVDPNPSTKKYIALEQKFLSLSKEFGHNNLVDFEPEIGEYFASRSVEENMSKNYIEEYDNDTFWDELLDRLVDRDINRNNSKKQLSQMTMEERLEKEEPIRINYEKEFEENGVEKLSII